MSQVWRPQRYRAEGIARGIEVGVLDAALASGEAVAAANASLPPIFTLNHLAYISGVEYGVLRAIVSREWENPYRVFRIRKRSLRQDRRRFRIICAPSPTLLAVQRWLAQNVLNNATQNVHASSTAYAPGSTLIDAAMPHCRSRWLVKIDVRRFFESITEISVYRAYRSLGYQPLVAFELGRLCTRLGSVTPQRLHKHWLRHHGSRHFVIEPYVHHRMGHLPQGAPTSPMLANLAMSVADRELLDWAKRHQMIYTRYADDLTFSTRDRGFNRKAASQVVRGVYRIIGRYGLSPNAAKTQVVPPRARKVVLGLLVDGSTPRLTREFKAKLRMHLYYLEHPSVGPVEHARKRGFAAVAGLRNHMQGLASYATQIEPAYGSDISARIAAVRWPL